MLNYNTAKLKPQNTLPFITLQLLMFREECFIVNLFSTLKEKAKNKIELTPIDMIVPNKHHSRLNIDSTEIKQLAQNLKDHGILQPLIVKKLENDMREIISGHRRFLAAKEANILKLPTISVDVCDKKIPILSLSENLHRTNLSFFEEANALFKLIYEFKFSQEMISTSLGVTQQFITDRLKVLKLSNNVKTLITTNNLTLQHALLLSKINNTTHQLKIIEMVIEKKLDVNQTNELISNYIENNLSMNFNKSNNNANKGTVYIIKDVKLFDNTISEAIDIMNKSGVGASSVKNECDKFIEYIIQIPKNKIYIKQSVGF